MSEARKKVNFSRSADHGQEWQSYQVDSYSDVHVDHPHIGYLGHIRLYFGARNGQGYRDIPS